MFRTSVLAIAMTALMSAPGLANPLVKQRADPHVSLEPDGWYYFTATVPEYDRRCW